MAYTQTDIENLERAAIALATGSRKESIVLSDGSRVDYTPTTLDALRQFIAEARSQVYNASSTARRGFVLGTTRKGF